MVEKLELSVTPHPTHYFVGWIASDYSKAITHQCLVTFSFPGYEDTVLCDVVDMNATHLILGRPWQYDVRAVHNYFENTYTFYKDGVKLILHPSRSSTIISSYSDETTRALVVTIARSLQKSHTLSSHEAAKLMVEIPTKVKPLTEQFNALFSDELPTSLPPLRDI